MSEFNQYLAISQARDKLQDIIADTNEAKTAEALQELDAILARFHETGIDFKEVVDNISESVLITDATGNVLYVNPAYTVNTGIQPEEILHRDISNQNVREKLFNGGVVPDILKTKKPAFRLSSTFKDTTPKVGYVTGTPLFDRNKKLKQIIAVSRPIISLKMLKDDFQNFVKELRRIEMELKTSTPDARSLLSQDEMIGKDSSLADIWQTIRMTASSDATVLITGESGVGKEVIADEIFRNSKRSDAPFVKINCASIPSHLLESELFGYEKGAFSGASSSGKRGLFEAANHGTLMLDEIGEMPLDLQAKLLRAIQSKEITRVGGIKPIQLDIRFIALTNCNLQEKIAAKEFRQDLFYRLNVVPIHVPPLRERKEDIEALSKQFISRFNREHERSFDLTSRQYDLLRRYNWPGNIRELENIIEYLVLCSSGAESADDHLITSLLNIPPEPEESSDLLSDEPQDFNDTVSRFEKKLLETTLEKCSNLREAGRRLNLNASTISRKIRQYQISYPSSHSV